MSCGCNKNQTHEAVFEFIKNQKLSLRANETIGFGIFIIPAPEKGILEYRALLVENLSYEDCIKRGSNCVSFQWIPKGFQAEVGGVTIAANTKEDIINAATRCNDSCRGGCPMGCYCMSGDTWCKPNPF